MHFELMHLDVWFTIPDMEDGKREILQIFIIQKDSTLKLFTKIIRNRLYSNILYQRAILFIQDKKFIWARKNSLNSFQWNNLSFLSNTLKRNSVAIIRIKISFKCALLKALRVLIMSTKLFVYVLNNF